MAALEADAAWPLWDSKPFEGAFEMSTNNGTDNAVVHSVERPWLFHYKPKASSIGRGILILGGGGYVELMVGREGVQVARWLTGLGFDAFVLVHRFPNAKSAPQAPVDDARRALHIIAAEGTRLRAWVFVVCHLVAILALLFLQTIRTVGHLRRSHPPYQRLTLQ